MKKTSKFLSIAIALAVGFASCNKDEEGDIFSPLGAEADKAKIEESGLGLIEDMRGLSETKFANTSADMVKVMNNSSSSAPKIVLAIAQLGDDMAKQKPVQDHFSNLKALATNNDGVLSSLWAEGKGTWEWNADIEDFDQTSVEGDEIIFMFPASEESTTNNAMLRIYDFEVYDGDFPGKGEVMEDGTVINEMLKSLYFEMKVDDELIASSNIVMDFSSTGDIENCNLTFNPIPYSFQAELGNVNNSVSWRYSFLNDTKVIFEHLLSGTYEGDLDEEAMVKTAATSIQVLEVKVVAEINAEAAIKQLAESTAETSQEEKQAMADALNNHAHLSIRYASDNTIIAKAIAVVVKDDISYGGDEWYIDLQFEFSDGSLVAAETFFENNLANFESELEKFMEEMENRVN